MAESKRTPVSAKASGGAEEKAKALETALAQIKKQFGEGAGHAPGGRIPP